MNVCMDNTQDRIYHTSFISLFQERVKTYTRHKILQPNIMNQYLNYETVMVQEIFLFIIMKKKKMSK